MSYRDYEEDMRRAYKREQARDAVGACIGLAILAPAVLAGIALIWRLAWMVGRWAIFGGSIGG